jgi:niacin transporter
MKGKKMVKGILLLALGVIVSYLFKLWGFAINIYLPIEITVLLAGFLLGPIYGLILGALDPLLISLCIESLRLSLILLMITKLGVYGLLSGLVYREFNILTSLISAIIGGKIIFWVGFWTAIRLFKVEQLISLISKESLLVGFYSIMIQIILIPVIITVINKKSSPKVDYKLRV